MHFIRQVGDGTKALQRGYIQVLNVPWKVGADYAGKGVWATLRFEAPRQAWLRVYDAAPDVPGRTCLAGHRFPLKEPVHPLQSTFQRTNDSPIAQWAQRLLRSVFRHAALW